MDEETLQAVSADGAAVGTVGRLAAHTAPGVLHAAFSVVMVGPDDRVLVQQRHHAKPTFGGAWSNTVCSHVRPGETVVEAAVRRTIDELGVEITPREVGRFVYKAVDPGTGFVEYELDHVVVAIVAERPELEPDPAEIDDVVWLTRNEVGTWLADPTVATTPWFPMVHAISGSYLATLG